MFHDGTDKKDKKNVRSINSHQWRRVIDANFNRAKEGLRVCEDICRFVCNQKKLTAEFKDLRHQLTRLVSFFGFEKMLFARDIKGDIGRGSINSEMKRENIRDIFYANIQRTKESVRVLEEFAKLMHASCSRRFKKMRYRLYGLEKKANQCL